MHRSETCFTNVVVRELLWSQVKVAADEDVIVLCDLGYPLKEMFELVVSNNGILDNMV